MTILSLMRFITRHPLNRQRRFAAVSRFVKWQISCRINPYPVVYQFTSRCKLVVQRGMTGATGNIYCGLHEFQDMAFVLHFLRPDDLFADIGANVGSYTVLASGHVGATTIAFEPAPGTFDKLKTNIEVNRLAERVTALNAAVGSKKGVLKFTTDFDTMNHVAGPDEKSTEVPVKMVDEVMNGRTPVLVKIDVEGFETEVLKGADTTLRSLALKGIIIELNGSGTRYGYDENEIHDHLLSLDFMPYEYAPFTRTLVPVTERGRHNTIYLRDLDFIMERLRSAEKFEIFRQEI